MSGDSKQGSRFTEKGGGILKWSLAVKRSIKRFYMRICKQKTKKGEDEMCYFSVDDFVFLQGGPPKSDVQNRFDSRVMCLLDAVNRLPMMRLVQPLRKGCTGENPGSPDAFNLRRADLVKYYVEDKNNDCCYHWYVFTTGFREMAQFNIGMCGDYLRVGIGFNISRNNAGPDVGQNVTNSFNQFKQLVLNDAQAFRSTISKLLTYLSNCCPGSSIGVEYRNLPLLLPDVNFIRDVTPDPTTNEFTHPSYRNSGWFFVGAILPPNNYTWGCAQTCSQASPANLGEEGDTSPGESGQAGNLTSADLEGNKDAVDLIEIIERVFTELFPYFGNSLVP